MAIVDVESAWVPGWAVGPSANRRLALECWRSVRDAYRGVEAERCSDKLSGRKRSIKRLRRAR
jgi:hypothetical protein